MKLVDWQREFRRAVKSSEPSGIFEFYREAFFERMLAALSADFPLLERLLGESRFALLVHEFLAEPRGFQPDLGEVSACFASFVGALDPENAMARAALVELAERECALSPEKGGAQGMLHPSARLLGCQGRHYLIWRSPEGVERIRIGRKTAQLLACFEGALDLGEIAEKLTELDLKPEFVQAETARWVANGLLRAN